MSTTYSIVCDDCKKKKWVGQSSGHSEIRFYDPTEVCVFMSNHRGHELRFVVDMIEPYDEYLEEE